MFQIAQVKPSLDLWGDYCSLAVHCYAAKQYNVSKSKAIFNALKHVKIKGHLLSLRGVRHILFPYGEMTFLDTTVNTPIYIYI